LAFFSYVTFIETYQFQCQIATKEIEDMPAAALVE